MAVFDSSPLILLANIGILDKVLEHLKEKAVITEKVFMEITAKETFDSKLLMGRVEEGRIERKAIKDKSLFARIIKDFNCDEGEAESIVLCLETNTGIVTDDKKAMKVSKLFNISRTTAANLLIRLYNRKAITGEEAEAYIVKLKKFGRYSDAIIEKVREEMKK